MTESRSLNTQKAESDSTLAASQWQTRLATGVVCCHVALLLYSGAVHSPVEMEANLLPAGYVHLVHGRFDVAQVNPPLCRMVCAIPLLFHDVKGDFVAGFRRGGIRPEYHFGDIFIRENNDSIQRQYQLCRGVAILFSIAAAVSLFTISRNQYGPNAAVAAVAIWCFCPMVLGHGSTVVHDMPGAAMLILSFGSFLTFHRLFCYASAVKFGTSAAIASLTRTSAIPVLCFWILVHFCNNKSWSVQGHFVTQLKRTTLAAFCFWVTFCAGYCFDSIMMPLGSFEFMSRTLSGRSAEQKSGNRFRGTLLEDIPIPLPKDFVHGIDLQQMDFETPPFPSYLYGEWREQGWWYYYIVAWFVKTPIGIQVLFVVGLLLMMRDGFLWRAAMFEALVIATVVVVFCVPCIKSGFTTHYRYVFSAIPFIALICARLWKKGVSSPTLIAIRAPLLLYAVGSSLAIFPHSLAYFNELAGGPKNGAKVLLHSSCDWGQDMYLLQRWYQQRSPDPTCTFIRCSGPTSPESLRIWGRAIPVRKDPSFRLRKGDNVIEPGLYVISVSALYDHTSAFRYLDKMAPSEFIGYTLRVYQVSAEDINRLSLNADEVE